MLTDINAPEMRYLAETSENSHIAKMLLLIKEHSTKGEVSCPYEYIDYSKHDFAFVQYHLGLLGFSCKPNSKDCIYIWWSDIPETPVKRWYQFWK